MNSCWKSFFDCNSIWMRISILCLSIILSLLFYFESFSGQKFIAHYLMNYYVNTSTDISLILLNEFRTEKFKFSCMWIRRFHIQFVRVGRVVSRVFGIFLLWCCGVLKQPEISPLAHFIQIARTFVKSQPVWKPNVNFNLKGNYNTVKHAHIVKCCLGTKTGCFILHKHNLLLNEFEILKMYINLYICQFI